MCWDINLKAALETATLIKEMGGEAHAFCCDVSDQPQVDTAARETLNTVSHIDFLINNAGIMPCHPFMNHSIQEVERCIDINVKGCIWVT